MRPTIKIEATPLIFIAISTIVSLILPMAFMRSAILSFYRHEIHDFDDLLTFRRHDELQEFLDPPGGLAVRVDEQRPGDRVKTLRHVLDRGSVIFRRGVFRDRERLMVLADVTH